MINGVFRVFEGSKVHFEPFSVEEFYRDFFALKKIIHSGPAKVRRSETMDETCLSMVVDIGVQKVEFVGGPVQPSYATQC